MPKRQKFTFEPPVFTFRARMLGGMYAPENPREIWREIEIAGNEPISDLGLAIISAFEFDHDHLWSFFLSGKAWDATTEYALSEDGDPFGFGGPRRRGPAKIDTIIRNMPFPGARGNKEFLFLFDYGDSWKFGVKFLRKSDEIEPGADYPRIVAGQGDSPPQYPVWEDEEPEEE